MFLEIERRFIVSETYTPSDPAGGVHMRACYLMAGDGVTFRIRIEGNDAVMTLKQRNSAIERAEFEYPVPIEDACYIMEHFPRCGHIVEKTRYTENIDGRIWEVDIFEGDNAPLRIAEVELDSADEELAVPEWAEREITGDDSYSNAALAISPYKSTSRS